MLLREKYHLRIEEAERSPRTVCSLICDMVDQQHILIPQMGSKSTFNKPLKQMILGCKEHGSKKLVLFRTIGTVSKGKNFTAYAILTMLEKWKESRRLDRYPETLFLQVKHMQHILKGYVLYVIKLD